MYFNANFNVFIKLIKVHLLVSELYKMNSSFNFSPGGFLYISLYGCIYGFKVILSGFVV